MLCKLVKEAEGFGLVLARDLIGSALGYRAAAAKAWLERCRAVVADLNNLANDQAALDAALKRAKAIAQDADLLSCNVSKDLERLKVRLRHTVLTLYLTAPQYPACSTHFLTFKDGRPMHHNPLLFSRWHPITIRYRAWGST